MRVVFMGTPEAAVPALGSLAAAHELVAAYTRPERPRGRGRRPQPTPVKVAALELGVSVVEPGSLRTPEEQQRLRSLEPDVVVVAAFGQILPQEVLDIPPAGCVNVHFSLLPRWRGAAPVERALLAGDDITGVTTMLMDAGLDTGPMLLAREVAVGPHDTTPTLTTRLADLGAHLLLETLQGLAAGTLTARPQPEDGVTYADKIDPGERELHPASAASDLERRVRALYPDAFTMFRGRRLKVLRAAAVAGDGEPARVAAVSSDGIHVQTRDGVLVLLEVQPEGKKPMDANAFVNGYRPEVGEWIGVENDPDGAP